jgi:hypothetical protein
LPAINPVSAATFGDRPDSGELACAAIALDDAFPIYNEAVVSRQAGVPQTATDAASQADYFPSTLQVTSLANSDSGLSGLRRVSAPALRAAGHADGDGRRRWSRKGAPARSGRQCWGASWATASR